MGKEGQEFQDSEQSCNQDSGCKSNSEDGKVEALRQREINC